MQMPPKGRPEFAGMATRHPECAVMFHTYWTVCDGKTCPIGQQKRGVGICCFQENNDASVTLKERCIREHVI